MNIISSALQFNSSLFHNFVYKVKICKKVSATKQLIEDIKSGFENLEKGNLNVEDIADLKAKALHLYDKLSIINYKIIEAQVKDIDTSADKIVKEIDRKEHIHQNQKNQTNLISAIQEQEVIAEGYNLSEKGLSFEDLLFENEAKTDTNETPSNENIDLFDTEAIEEQETVATSTLLEEDDITEKEEVSNPLAAPEVTPPPTTNKINTITPELEDDPIEKEQPSTPPVVDAKMETEVNKIDSSINEQLAEKNNQPSLADKLAEDHKEAQQKEIVSKMQKDPIVDLKKAISINQKFIFINDLFNGEVGVYNDMIEQINNAGDMNTAEGLLKAISQEYQWDTDSASVMNFIDLVQRRF